MSDGSKEDIFVRYQAATDKFVDHIRRDEDVIGVVVAGSLAYGQIDKN